MAAETRSADPYQLLETMAEDMVVLLRLHPCGRFGAAVRGIGAARAEAAAGGRIDGAGQLPFLSFQVAT